MSVKQENPAGLVGPSGSAGPPRLALLRHHPGTLLHRLAIVTAVDCVPALLGSSAFVNWRGQRHGCRKSQLHRKESRSRLTCSVAGSMDGTSKPTSVNRRAIRVRLERGNLIFRDTGSFTTWR